MPYARFFCEDENGNAVLQQVVDLDTKEVTYYVDEQTIADQCDKNMERAGRAASDIVRQDPDSALLKI